MKIESIHVKNYKSILDSSAIHIEDKLTIFIGKNESGKSNLLKSIRDINNLKEDAGLYPYRNNNYKSTISLLVKLSEEEKEELFQKYEVLINDSIKIDIFCGPKILPNIEEKKFWEELDAKFIDKFNNDLGLKCNLKFNDDDEKLIKNISNEENGDILIEKYNNLVKEREILINQIFDSIVSFIPKIKYLSTMENLLPKTITPDNIDKTPVVLLANFIKKQSAGKYTEDIFKNILNCTDSQERKKNCDNISKILTNFFVEYYRQYELKFDLSSSGNSIDIFVKDYYRENQEDGMGLYLDQRSTGLNWFVSFIITCNSFNANEIFVLDEPGMYLHLEAQQDMLTILKHLSEERQVIICTHSPYLIDVNMIPIIRLVEKIPSKLDDMYFEETKIYKNLHSFKDKDTIQTLCDAIGFNLAKGLTYHSEKALLVEGVSDLILIKVFAKIINKRLDYDIYFAKSSNKMDILYAMLSGLGIKKFVGLFDSDTAGLSMYKDMPYIKDYSVFTHSLDAEVLDGKKKLSKNRSIEDIFSKDDFDKYYLLNNEEYLDSTKTNSELAKIKNSKYLDSKILLDNVNDYSFSEETKTNIKSLFERIQAMFEKYN